MKTFEELTEYVAKKANEYLTETGTEMENGFPRSIVDFVIEHFTDCCHFPKGYSEEQKVTVLANHKNSMAMACNDIFAKIGAEGQTGHNENNVSRSYETSWITPRLLSGLPNFVNIIG